MPTSPRPAHDQTTTKVRRPASLPSPSTYASSDPPQAWIPDPDDPPLIAPYVDPFLALLVGIGIGGITMAILAAILVMVLL